MIRDRLKQGIKQGLKKVLRVDISGPQPDYGVDPRHRGGTAAPPSPPASPPPAQVAPPTPPVQAAPAEVETPAAQVETPAVQVETPAVQVETPAAQVQAPDVETTGMDPSDDTAGPPMTMEAVQEILDDMVRPALQGDGGDISLIKIEENSIYVKLVGSCSSCPSSIMTMKMGVEALLKEEFPQMRELVQVD